VLTYLLVKLGARYDLVTTDAGDQVMRLVKKEMPDLIVCDIDMPDVDGGDISAQLYGDDKTRYIPMLFLSALVPAKDAKRGEVGGRPAISKSAPIDELIARIESLMV
jgi:CheY-like chemotaxis protein